MIKNIYQKVLLSLLTDDFFFLRPIRNNILLLLFFFLTQMESKRNGLNESSIIHHVNSNPKPTRSKESQ